MEVRLIILQVMTVDFCDHFVASCQTHVFHNLGRSARIAVGQDASVLSLIAGDRLSTAAAAFASAGSKKQH